MIKGKQSSSSSYESSDINYPIAVNITSYNDISQFSRFFSSTFFKQFPEIAEEIDIPHTPSSYSGPQITFLSNLRRIIPWKDFEERRTVCGPDIDGISEVVFRFLENLPLRYIYQGIDHFFFEDPEIAKEIINQAVNDWNTKGLPKLSKKQPDSATKEKQLSHNISLIPLWNNDNLCLPSFPIKHVLSPDKLKYSPLKLRLQIFPNSKFRVLPNCDHILDTIREKLLVTTSSSLSSASSVPPEKKYQESRAKEPEEGKVTTSSSLSSASSVPPEKEYQELEAKKSEGKKIEIFPKEQSSKLRQKQLQQKKIQKSQIERELKMLESQQQTMTENLKKKEEDYKRKKEELHKIQSEITKLELYNEAPSTLSSNSQEKSNSES